MLRKIIVAASMLAISSVAANAATATGSLGVSVTIAAVCTVTNGTLAFGSQTSIAANVDATGTFGVTCSNGAAYSMALDNGANFSGSRRMTDGTNFITYQLYSDAGRTTAWSAVSGTGTGAAQTISVYGRIPGQTSPGNGAYTDTVGITVTY